MDDVWKLISSPSFIVGTLVCGLLLNLLSNYVQRRIDLASSRWGAWRRSRTEAQQAAFDATLSELVARPNLVELFIAREARLWAACVAFMLLAVIMGGLYLLTGGSSLYLFAPRLIILLGAVGFLAGSLTLLDTAMRAGDLLRALYKKRLADPM